MFQLPNFSKSFEYENDFYLSCDINRMSKVLAHYELYKKVLDVPGAFVECGVFKGASFSRFAMFRELLSNPYSKKMIAFDIFGEFPETEYKDDFKKRESFIQGAGNYGISPEQLNKVLDHKGVNKNIDIIKGDIVETVPQYIKDHPELKISILNLDTDIYEPAVTILEHLYPRIVSGGILILDDYAVFPGETAAVDEYFKNQNVEIKKFPFAMTPCYVIKP